MPTVPALLSILAPLEQGNAAGAPAPAQPVAPQVADPNLALQRYEGLVAQRAVLRSQLDDLEGQRVVVRQEFRAAQSGVDQAGLEQRLAAIDQRIAKSSIDLAEVEAQIVVAAGVPGAVPPDPGFPDMPRPDNQSDELFAMGIAFASMLAMPIVIAHARRIWNRGALPAAAALPHDLSERLRSMERAVESVAVEVERIGEGQRFVTQLLASRADEAAKQLK